MLNPGLHATPIKNAKSISLRGLQTQGFWKNRKPLKRLFGGRVTAPAWVLRINPNQKSTLKKQVKKVLERANRHFGKKNARINIRKIRVLLVDLEKSKIIRDGEIHVAVKSPPHALRNILISNEEITRLEEQTSSLGDQKANELIVNFVTEKVREML